MLRGAVTHRVLERAQRVLLAQMRPQDALCHDYSQRVSKQRASRGARSRPAPSSMSMTDLTNAANALG